MDKIEEKLGFDQVRQMVVQQCTNEQALHLAEQMHFITHFDTLRQELNLLEEMRNILLMESDFPQQDYLDLSPMLSRLRVEGTSATEEELFGMRLSLQTIGDLLRFLLDSEREQAYPNLREMAEQVQLDPTIVRDLARLIDDHGEVYDNASPALLEIRRQMTRKAAEVEAQVSHALQRAKREGWAAPDAEATLRDGRPVIPLLTTHRRKMRGLIQDESASRQTAFVEPAEVVELGNDMRELQFEERREINRILREFSQRLRPQLPALDEAYRFLAKMDFLRAKARVGIEMNASIPLLTSQPHLDWRDARHPLLYLQKHDAVVPFDLELHRILIISGPNAGGKSVTLKAIGLIQYMLQCGMAVPLRPTSECGIFHEIHIDIGDQQSIADELSTYTSHLMNMKRLIAAADSHTLFLIDELGSGTEPRSGCAIAEAVMEELYERGSYGVVTTHFADLKLLADHYEEIQNGAMLFDTERMRPLYRLSVGHPGSSFAFEIAASIGFPEEVLSRASEKVGTAQLNFEHQLQQLEVDKKEIARQREELRVADEFLAEVTEKYQRLSDNLQTRRHEIISSARREAQQILEGANRTVERTISDIKSASAEKEATRKARAELSQATQQLQHDIHQAEHEQQKRTAPRTLSASSSSDPVPPLQVGTIVRIDGGDSFGQVVEIKGKKAVVESNSLRMSIALSRLQPTAKQKIPTEKSSPSERFHSIFDEMNEKRAHFQPTLDLRGHRADEAIDELHRFIDEATLLGEKEVRILHGKGYGVLMQVVRQELHASPAVRSFHAERIELGGEGITVAELR